MTDERRRSRMPPMTLKPSALERHQLNMITANTFVRPRNTVAMAGVDVAREIELINLGYGEKVGDSRYRINGRLYVHKPNGLAYPESGERVEHVPRPQFLILCLLIKHQGRTVEFDNATERNPVFTEDRINDALRFYRLWKDAQP